MPWTETSVLDSRISFINAWREGDLTMSELCARHEISRRTGHKWVHRYESDGLSGLFDLSSARHTYPQTLSDETRVALLKLRERRPTWGPRKLLARLRLDDPEAVLPAASTVGDWLRREGLSRSRRRSRVMAGKHEPVLIEPLAANDSWAADFKGWFRTGDGVRCEPLTVTDGFSRYLLVCQALPRVTFEEVYPVMERVFREHGLPRALRTDNGNPFARRDGLCGLSRFSVWLLKLDVFPDFITPGRPDMNGRHERMHRVLNEDTAKPPAGTLKDQQRRFDRWRKDYNTYRPHEALGQRCPAEFWHASPRAYPGKIRPWDYPADHHVRRVIGDGHIRWRDGTIYLSAALKGEDVGLKRRDDGGWTVWFRNYDLTVIDDRTNLPRKGMLRPAGVSRSSSATSPVDAVKDASRRDAAASGRP
jgi:transposase InsO family protein